MILKGKFPSAESVKNSFIRSTLIQADLAALDRQMEADEATKELMLCPADRLPDKYKYLLADFFNGWEKTNLYMLIERTLAEFPPDQVWFSMAGNKIVGWCAYSTIPDYRDKSKTVVNNMKMFSFDVSRPNPVLLRDLEKLVQNLLDEYGMVSWVAVPENPANKIYKRVVEKYGGSAAPFNRLIHYTIGKENDEQNL